MTKLYRHYDKDDNLLYVGISLSPTYRLSQHKKNSHWFNEIARIDIETYSSREEALQNERKAINEENPKHNVMKPVYKSELSLEINENYIEDSKNDLLKRLVQFNPSYSLDEAGKCLGVGATTIKKWIDDNKLGYIVVGYAKGRWGISEKRRITGWQLIECIENLENENNKSNMEDE